VRNITLKIIKIKLKGGKILKIVLNVYFQASKKESKSSLWSESLFLNLASKPATILIFGIV